MQKMEPESTDIITVVGNRPQFIKMAPISRELLNRGYKEFIIHTGQHFDENMSEIFFEELKIPKPNVHLNIGGGSHGKMTGQMLMELEDILMEKQPKGIIIYGDTNSTLAAALAAVKLHIPIAHIEAGPRIYDINTPEEINRIVADHAARFRFCPDLVSVQNLSKENITKGVFFSGDVMYDAFLNFSKVAEVNSSILKKLNINDKEYALMTVHRPNNTKTNEALLNIIKVLKESSLLVVFPIHPRTEAAFKSFGLWDELLSNTNAKIIPAVGYLDILQLVNHAKIIVTDSGGLQKEAFFAGKPVLILFHTTPWPQIEESGWQVCCWKDGSIDVKEVLRGIREFYPKNNRPELFGNGNAAKNIIDILEQNNWFN